MDRRKAIATAKMVITIGFAIFALFAFNMGTRAASESTDQVLAQLAQEVADRIAKALILLDSVEKGTIKLQLPAKYDVGLKQANKGKAYVVEVQYKNYDKAQSKRFKLRNAHPAKQLTVFNDENSMEQICLMKYKDMYSFVNPKSPGEFTVNAMLASSNLNVKPDPEKCAFQG